MGAADRQTWVGTVIPPLTSYVTLGGGGTSLSPCAHLSPEIKSCSLAACLDEITARAQYVVGYGDPLPHQASQTTSEQCH